MACTCDWSYTCQECQTRIDAANAVDYANELRDWLVESMQLVAEKLGVQISDPPQKRDNS